jgi:hypothetical protein
MPDLQVSPQTYSALQFHNLNRQTLQCVGKIWGTRNLEHSGESAEFRRNGLAACPASIGMDNSGKVVEGGSEFLQACMDLSNRAQI